MVIEMNMTMKWVKVAKKIKWKLKWNDDENGNCGGLGGFPPHGEKY